MKVITLMYMTEDAEQADATLNDFFDFARNISRSGQGNITVSSYIEDEEEAPKPELLRYDDETMFKAREAMSSIGLKDGSITSIINNLQNAGILLRERL